MLQCSLASLPSAESVSPCLRGLRAAVSLRELRIIYTNAHCILCCAVLCCDARELADRILGLREHIRKEPYCMTSCVVCCVVLCCAVLSGRWLTVSWVCVSTFARSHIA
jgi:hypothetical protein